MSIFCSKRAYRNSGILTSSLSLGLSAIAGISIAAPITNTASITTPDGSDPNSANNTAVDSDEVVRLSANKVAVDVTGPDNNGQYIARYRITIANPEATDAVYGQLIDTLDFPTEVEVLGASWSCVTAGTACATGSSNGAGPYILAGNATPILALASHIYELSVRFHYTDLVLPAGCAAGDGLSNTVSLPTGQEEDNLPNTACLAPPALPNTGLTLLKTAGTPTGASVGATVPYSFSVTNSGNVTLTSLAITDVKLDGPATCVSLTLAPGASTTCSGLRTLTQQDLDDGQTENTATATGTPPTGNPVTSPPSTAVVQHPQTPLLELIKTAGTPTGETVGSTLEYQFALSNTGNVTLTDLSITDALLDGPATCLVLTLAPGEATTCSGLRTLTQQDLDDGQTVNIATANGKTPGGGDVTTPPSSTTTLYTRSPALTLVKTAGTPTAQNVGASLPYDFVLTNTGNVTLSNLSIADALLDGPATCLVLTLAPGEATTCTGIRTLTQKDIDDGQTVNIATATGVPPGGGEVITPPSTTTTVYTRAPAISLLKTAGTPTAPVAGASLPYSFLVTNTGNVTLTDISITDALLDGPADCPVNILVAGASTTCTGLRTLTQAEINKGLTENTATVTGTPPGQSEPVASPPSTTVTVYDFKPALTLDKVALQSTYERAGETVSYEYRLTNTGNVTINDLVVSDDRISNVICPQTTIEPTEVVTCSADYVVSQEDLDLGFITNVATVTGTPVAGTLPSVTDTETVDAVLRPSIAIEKTATLSRDAKTIGLADANDEISYAVVVTNTGNLTLADLTVTDSFQGGAATQLSCAPLVLAPGQQALCDVYTHVVTQQEANYGGLLENIATVTGVPSRGNGDPVTALDKANVELAAPATILRVVKQAAPRDVKVGDIVRYSVTIENLGLTDAEDVTLYDTPPAGFTLIENSLTVADYDGQGRLSGNNPFRVDQIDIKTEERATISYLLRVGAGVRPGVHVNQALAQDGDYSSNTATAEVRLIGDPLMDESLIIGTVYDDRDGDGWQDSAHLDAIRVSGGLDPNKLVGPATIDGIEAPASLGEGLEIKHLAARQSIADPAPQVVISQSVTEPVFTDDFVLQTRQGLTLRMAQDGSLVRDLSGDAARGLTSADPTVERRVSATDKGYRVDYVIGNKGIDERGIAGVRIASVEGLLIETDPYGRYHLEGVHSGEWERGRNFILSVDPASLPQGSVFTTENPRLRRITPGLPVRFDFGVQLPVEIVGGGTEDVVMKLAEVVFAPESAQVRDIYAKVLDHMADEIKARGAGDIIITANGETQALAYARAVAVHEAMAQRLTAQELAQLSVTVQTDREDTQNWVARITDTPVLGQVLFDTDKSAIRPEFNALLDQVAATLEATHGEIGTPMVIRLIGHTDLRASDDYNLRLGLRRSQAVFEALASRLSPSFRSKLRVEITNASSASAVQGAR